MSIQLAEAAFERADALLATEHPQAACQWYLAAADQWSRANAPRAAALAVVCAARTAVALARPTDALEMLDDAERLVNLVTYPHPIHAELAAARAVAHMALDDVTRAGEQWTAAVATNVRLFRATHALDVYDTACRSLGERGAPALRGARATAEAIVLSLMDTTGSSELHATLAATLRRHECVVPTEFAAVAPVIEHAHDHLVDTVGSALSAGLSEAQLDEFEALVDGADDAATAQWMACNVPHADAIAAREVREHLACLEVLITAPTGFQLQGETTCL